jgi:hypothetical protein
MSLIDEAREVKDWINSDDDPCDTGDLEPELVLQMCNHILAKPKKSKKTAGVWQITEERKAAIDKGMRVLAWVNPINPELEPDVCLEVLQAMLEEIKS